jgi:glycosyl transferase, family 25
MPPPALVRRRAGERSRVQPLQIGQQVVGEYIDERCRVLNVPTYVINLRNRADRRNHVVGELQAAGVNIAQVRTVEAQRSLRNGAIGCAASHAYALSRFLYESDAPFCWIVEDDFQIKNRERLADLPAVLLAHEEWDVMLLASNVPYAVSGTTFAGVYRVHNAQTTSSYLVTRRYAPTLIKLFYDSAERMSTSALVVEKTAQKHFYAVDMAWKNLQISDRFFAFIPQLSHQMDSYSDVEQKDVSYGA